MGRRQVVRHLVLVQASRRFESFRPSQLTRRKASFLLPCCLRNCPCGEYTKPSILFRISYYKLCLGKISWFNGFKSFLFESMKASETE